MTNMSVGSDDIIRRNKAEVTAPIAGVRLEAALDSIADAVLVTDVEGTSVYANSACASFHKFNSVAECPRTLAEYSDCLDAYMSDGRLAALDQWAVSRALLGEVADGAEYTLRRKDTGEAWIGSFNFAPVRDEVGRIVGSVVMARDITKRKRAEAALRESELQFHTLANAIPQLCWTAKSDGWIDWYNERWYQYTGTTAQQMEGWGWQSVHDPQMLPKVLERWRSSIATGRPFEMVFPLRGADGQFRSFLTRVTPVTDRDGNVVRWFGTNTDITEQEKAQEEIRSGRAQLEAALASMSDGIYIADASGRALQFNDAFLKMLRFPSAAEACKTLEEYFAVFELSTPDGRIVPFDQRPSSRAMRGESAIGVEYRIRRRDSGESWIMSYNFAPIRTERGEITGVVFTLRDISEKKEQEARFASLNAQLTHVTRVHELSQVSAGIAHELNQPLAAMVNYANLAKRLTAELPGGDKAVEAIARAGEQAVRAGQIIRRVRDLVERRQTNRAPQGVNAIVADATALALVGAEGDNITTVQNLAPELPLVNVDRVQIEQVLVNLLRNAVDAIAASPKREITISTCATGDDAVEVSVADTGPGVSHDVAGRLFMPFMTTKPGGMGIGLSISRSIVEAHGGKIETVPNPSGGAIFRFTLPACTAVASPDSSPRD